MHLRPGWSAVAQSDVVDRDGEADLSGRPVTAIGEKGTFLNRASLSGHGKAVKGGGRTEVEGGVGSAPRGIPPVLQPWYSS